MFDCRSSSYLARRLSSRRPYLCVGATRFLCLVLGPGGEEMWNHLDYGYSSPAHLVHANCLLHLCSLLFSSLIDELQPYSLTFLLGTRPVYLSSQVSLLFVDQEINYL